MGPLWMGPVPNARQASRPSRMAPICMGPPSRMAPPPVTAFIPHHPQSKVAPNAAFVSKLPALMPTTDLNPSAMPFRFNSTIVPNVAFVSKLPPLTVRKDVDEEKTSHLNTIPLTEDAIKILDDGVRDSNSDDSDSYHPVQQRFVEDALMNTTRWKYQQSSIGTESVYNNIEDMFYDTESKSPLDETNDLKTSSQSACVIMNKNAHDGSVKCMKRRKKRLPLQFQIDKSHSYINEITDWDDVGVYQMPWCYDPKKHVLFNSNMFYMQRNGPKLYSDQFGYCQVTPDTQDNLNLELIQKRKFVKDSETNALHTCHGIFDNVEHFIDHCVSFGERGMLHLWLSGIVNNVFGKETKLLEYVSTKAKDHVLANFPPIPGVPENEYRQLAMECMTLSGFDGAEIVEKYGDTFITGDVTDRGLLFKYQPAPVRALLAGIQYTELSLNHLKEKEKIMRMYHKFQTTTAKEPKFLENVWCTKIHPIFHNTKVADVAHSFNKFTNVSDQEWIRGVSTFIVMCKSVSDDCAEWVRFVSGHHSKTSDPKSTNSKPSIHDKPGTSPQKFQKGAKISLAIESMSKINALQTHLSEEAVFNMFGVLIEILYGRESNEELWFVDAEELTTGNCFGWVIDLATGYVNTNGALHWAMKHGYEVGILKRPEPVMYQLQCFMAILQQMKMLLLNFHSSNRFMIQRLNCFIKRWICFLQEIEALLINKNYKLADWRAQVIAGFDSSP